MDKTGDNTMSDVNADPTAPSGGSAEGEDAEMDQRTPPCETTKIVTTTTMRQWDL